ncbi:MAG: endonuclease/exonuclease/phosphatase family protein, partial [Bacteroidota bacterium]
MKTILNSLIFILTFTISLNAQNEYKIGAIGFYNFENLFDTLDTPNKIDEDFTPMGALKWNTEHYQEKIGNLAKVISEVATNRTPDGLALLGVAEIENQSVLEDFVNHPLISKRNYKIVHYESPDVRGIDVALLYQEKYFKLKSSKKMPLLIHDDNGDRIYTRDILLVEGMYDGDLMYVMVNHWPSRRGGEEASQPYRNAAALLCKNTSDSILAQHPEAKIIIMGDLNDDPVSPSVSKIIRAKKKANSVKANG